MGQLILSRQISSILLRYYFGPDHPCKIRLWGWLMKVMNHPRFTVGFSGGVITLDPRDWIQSELLTNGEFGEDVWVAIDAHAEKDEVFWDIGAHVGTVAVRAMNDARFSAVHAFEPHPATFNELKTNVTLNGSSGHAHNFALTDRSGQIELFEGLSANTGLASIVPRWNTKSISVATRTIDECIAQGLAPAPTLVKIDTEGAEKAVLHGAARLFQAHPPKAIIFESEFARGAIRDPEIQKLLEGYGYNVTPLSSMDTDEGCINWLASRQKVGG